MNNQQLFSFISLMVLTVVGGALVFFGKLDPSIFWGFLAFKYGAYAFTSMKSGQTDPVAAQTITPTV